MTSFLLAGRRKLPPETPPSPNESYDTVRQLWIDADSDEPLVTRFGRSVPASQYGETSLTETREGADQSEGTIHASPYGETSITKTQEGADQSESSYIVMSPYGETTKTATREGVDQPERAIESSSYGETISTRTREGSDQTEISSEASAHNSPGTHPVEAGVPDLTTFDSRTPHHAPHPHF